MSEIREKLIGAIADGFDDYDNADNELIRDMQKRGNPMFEFIADALISSGLMFNPKTDIRQPTEPCEICNLLPSGIRRKATA